jgi:hypothetical protein
VPASVRHKAAGGRAPGNPRVATGSPRREAHDDDLGTTTTGGATVVLVFGIVVGAVVLYLWLRRRKARRTSLHAVETGDTDAPNGRAPLVMGATTRWSCGHEQTLVRPLARGLSPGSAPCPTCGQVGIVAQLVAGRFVPVVP